MDRFDRIYVLYRILRQRRAPIPRKELERQMDCSRATVQRAIEDLRDRLGAPVRYDRELNGYRLDPAAPAFELPGLWFSPDELHALLASHQLLSSAQPGLLDDALAPFRQRIEQVLSHRHAGHRDLVHRVRILHTATRPLDPDSFRKVAAATVERRRLKVLYHGRARDALTERWLSPQRLVHYRANWYLDAWCHLRRALRSFAIDRLHVIAPGDAAKDIDDAKLDRHFASAYGIFAGRPKHTAVLHFSSDAARWVADERWHPRQKSQILPDGGIELRIPYGDPRELILDILKYGPEVEVIAPISLRREVAARLARAAGRYVQA